MSYITDDDLLIYKNELNNYCKSGYLYIFAIYPYTSSSIINSKNDNDENCFKKAKILKPIGCRYNRGTIITDMERLSLLTWATGIMNNLTRLDFRRGEYILHKDSPEIPPLIFEIKKRIEKKECLVDNNEQVLLGRGNHFMGFVFPNGKIMKHTDKNDIENNLFQIRFNVFLLLPGESFRTYYNNKIINTQQGTYAMCLSGIEEHWTDTNLEKLPRISLSFGYSLPRSKIDELLPA